MVMALFGMSVTPVAQQLHETAHAHMASAGQGRDRGEGCRRLLGCRARGHRRIDDTAKRRNQSYISIMANLDGQRAVAVTQGRDKGALGRL